MNKQSTKPKSIQPTQSRLKRSSSLPNKGYPWLRKTSHLRWLALAFTAAIAAFGLVFSSITHAATPAPTSASLLTPATSFTTRKDIRYSTLSTSNSLKLDLYTPNNGVSQAPLIIWIHGGGWNSGTKDTGCAPFEAKLMLKGFSVACINYRLSGEAKWPAQIIDVKSAIRSLRANAATYKLYPTKIGVWGASAGGHLATLAATANNVPAWEQGQYLNVSSSVQAVRDDYGPMDMIKWAKDPCCGWFLQPANSFLSQLFASNTPVLNNQAKATTANPIAYIDGDEPPISIWHGDKDILVPLNQSKLLYDSLLAKGDTATYEIVPGMGHGDSKYYTPTVTDGVANMFDTYLRP